MLYSLKGKLKSDMLATYWNKLMVTISDQRRKDFSKRGLICPPAERDLQFLQHVYHLLKSGQWPLSHSMLIHWQLKDVKYLHLYYINAT